MDRYFVWHSLFDPGQPRWLVVDRVMGGWDRETGDRHVASCPDPEMAQRIADLLNEQPTIEALRQEIKDLEGRIDSIAYDIHDSYAG